MDSIVSPCPNCPTSLLSVDDDHLQVAASQVICEWASGVVNKSFANSLQLAQHLTSNKLVSKSSKSILVVQSHMGERLDLTPEMRHRETNFHLKQTLQYRQEIRKKQAEENMQRMQEGLSPVNTKPQVNAPSEDDLYAQVSRTDKATQLERKDVPGAREVSNTHALPESSENSTSNTESTTSSCNASVGEAGTVTCKESPSKRRFAPIQPKTPVRDTSAPVVLLNPSAQNVGGQPLHLLVVNGVNNQKVLQGVPKLTSPQQMNVIVQGKNVYQSPVQTVAAVGSQTPVNVLGSPVVGNTVIGSPVIPASIQNAIKSGQIMFVGNQPMKQVQGICSGLQTVSNANAAIRQNQGQTVNPNPVAVVAQAAPTQPPLVVSTSSVACQKSVLSSQGININTGTSNMRSQNMTPVFIERTVQGSVANVTSPVNVMAHQISHHQTKLASTSNVIVRTAPSSSISVPNSRSVVASGQSTLTTSVTFATQPMKLSSVAVINSDSFQDRRFVSNVSQSGIDLNKRLPCQFTIANQVISSNKLDKVNPASRPSKNVVNALPTEFGKSLSNASHLKGLIQNGGAKTVASLLRSAQAFTSLASTQVPKASTSSTANQSSSNVLLAQLNVPAQSGTVQQDNSNMQHFLIQTAPEDAGGMVASNDRDPLTTVSGLTRVFMGSQDLSGIQPGSILTRILSEDTDTKPGNGTGLALQQVALEDARGVLNQLVAQPSVSILGEADTNTTSMLMVPGMSAATMLPQKPKAEESGLISNLPQMQTAHAINSSHNTQIDGLANISSGKQCAKLMHLTQVQASQPRMLERLLASTNLSYINSPVQAEGRSARSVPTTPIAELQSPPHMLRAQSAAIPVQQGDSVPPSPVDGKSFAFTPINFNEINCEESPIKPKHKPKATHPVPNILNQALANNEVQDPIQDPNQMGKNKGKRTQQFVTPTRKRRLSSNSKRMAASSPSSVQFQPQMRQTMTSPAASQLTTQQLSLAMPNNPQTSRMSIATNNLHINSSFGQNQQQLSWQRRRNPSGPACPTNIQTSQIETELMNLLNNPQTPAALQAMRALQSRSQSVPLPEQPGNRIFRLQLPTQPELTQNLNQDNSNQIITTQLQVIPILSSDQVNDMQTGAANNFGAKRNLTQDLLDIDVTEEDFAPCNTMLNTEITAPNPVPVLHNPAWPRNPEETVMAPDPNDNAQIADFGLKYHPTDQQNGNNGQISGNQSLLPSNQAFNDASNSTASSISESMIMEELSELSELGNGETFGLPPTPWQMGTSSTGLSTLECGM